MKDPIKIIHKFKNNNKRMQYKVYIFLGTLVPNNIIKILEGIKDKNFYDMLNTISKNDYNELEKYYGIFWYQFFYINSHIKKQINEIKDNNTKNKNLKSKFNDEWYEKHIYTTMTKKMPYSFSTNYYNINLLKNKIKTQTRKLEMDFRTYNVKIDKIDYNDLRNENDLDELSGGGDKSEDEDDEIEEEKIVVSNEADEVEQDVDDEEIEDLNVDELVNLYANVEIDTTKNIENTSKLISEALDDKKWDKNIENKLKKYDNSLDGLNYDSNIEDIYNKHYIFDQYIFKDDTIKTIRNKISLSIPISPNFNKNIHLLPETVYLWSEYELENNKNNEDTKVMLGQKWIRRNELLKIDIEPNPNLKVYEKLRENLSYLKDSFGYKIKREDDETNILRQYENFMSLNEIYMLDIYNELGLNYVVSQEEQKNLYDVYVSIYFPLILYDRLGQIIQLLNGKNDKEIEYIDSVFKTIMNDNKLETEIENIVEKSKLDLNKYNKLFSENHIMQSIIHVNTINPKNITGTNSDMKFNLYRIFDNFIVNEKFPFIQYQTAEIPLTYKLFTKSDKIENTEQISKWFENSPYGLSFKYKIDNNKAEDKYITINLHEVGKIDYKITWKESDEATVEDINKSYEYVKDLLKKINSENKKVKIMLPTDDKFKYAFINSIQKFAIPDKFKINHNDLSDFSRFFFPYVSLVIEPRKRKSKKGDDDISKYGTYLRYKRISKYENKIRIHLRLLYLLRNYDATDKEIIDEITAQFNVTIDYAIKELEFVREKFSKIIKRSNKVLKKLKHMPRSKPTGISIDIQGRDKNNYKISIRGARDKNQLNEIIDFMKVLIYLYIETYLYKNKEYQHIRRLLETLTKIAKRRNKVVDIENHDTTNKTIKSLIKLDKARLGYKPEKGQSQWTRSCQNSGNDKRQPTLIQGDNIEKLLKDGYKLNSKTGYYEKEVNMKIKGKQYKTVVKAIKLSGDEDVVNYYTCDPSENKDNIHIGFLTKGNNPNNLCMPCCFKKDQALSVNTKKKNYYFKCLGDKRDNNESKDKHVLNITDKVYILQDTNKVQDGRFIYLPKYLDIFFNSVWNHDKKIKNHYLYESKSGYFFKYTVKHDYFYFLITLAHIYDLTINELLDKLSNFLSKDKDNIYFTYLNNGLISQVFKTRDKYIDYIKTSNYLEYDIIGELTSIPNVISPRGINFYILNKQIQIVKKSLEKEEIKERYYLECLNNENFNEFDEDRDIIILIREEKYYFPIYRIQRDEKKDKKIKIDKYFNDNILGKILAELRNYHNKSCKNYLINEVISNNNLSAKYIINKYDKIKKQYIDDKNKCKYLELDNGLFLPVKQSGISYRFPFDNIKNIKSKYLSLENTIKNLDNIEKILKLNYIPKTIYFDDKKDNKINIISILLNNNLIIPISQEYIHDSDIKKLGLSVRFQPLEETINQTIINYNNEPIYDNRYLNVKLHNYKSESYNLFRLELSFYLSNNTNIKDLIINIVRNKNMNINDKKHELRKILFDIIDSKLAEEYKLSQKGGKKELMTFITKEVPNLKNYIIHNIRDNCYVNNSKDKCESNLNCVWKNDICKLQLVEDMAIDFVNKVIEEMVQDGISFKEIIQEHNYYVSDIVNYTQYSNRDNEKIIIAANLNINKILSELFGKDKIPKLGKRQSNRINKDIINEEYPELIEQGNQYIQMIEPNKDSIIRAFVNSYYWINNPLYDNESRNLGYNSELQTNITYLFKAYIIDFIQTNLHKGDEKIKSFLHKYFKYESNFFESNINKFRKNIYNTNGIIELFVLSHIFEVPIVVYDNFNNVRHLFLQGYIKPTPETINNFTKEDRLNKTIFVKLEYSNSSSIPRNIYSIYYK